MRQASKGPRKRKRKRKRKRRSYPWRKKDRRGRVRVTSLTTRYTTVTPL
jgi:hypothetical protein